MLAWYTLRLHGWCVLTWLQQERCSEKLITLVKDIAKDGIEVGCIKQALCQQQYNLGSGNVDAAASRQQ